MASPPDLDLLCVNTDHEAGIDRCTHNLERRLKRTISMCSACTLRAPRARG
jgi:hypothetical protein